MKKKFAIIFVCLILAATFALTGCSGAGYSKIKVNGVQNTDYIVRGNGGNSVQYGNYLYFINGTKGYTDENGKNNVWGEVTKGGLYRAELKGSKVGRDFVISDAEEMEFNYSIEKDYDDKDAKVVKVQLIASKVIGTSGYNNGGIFIFDNYIYYASPNNEKDKTGAVQINKTDFFRTKLDGSITQKLYTTQGDSATSPYAFYKRGDSVYLVTYYNSQLVSVKVKGDKKPEAPVTIATKVKGAYLPYRSDYDSADNSVILEDFVYVLRDVTEDEPIKVGMAIEVLSPDGKEGQTVVSLASTDMKIESVRDGLLFYRSNKTTLGYDNLHTAMMDIPSYKSYHDSITDEDLKIGQLSDPKLFVSDKLSEYTATYCFRPGGIRSDLVYIMGVNSTGAFLISNNANERKQVYSGAITFSFIDDEYMYFTESEGKTLFRTRWDQTVDEKTASGTLKEQVTHGDMTDNGLKADITAGYIVYMGDVDTWAKGYANFKKIKGAEGTTQFFVGAKIEEDLKPKEEEEEEEEEKGCGAFVPFNANVAGGAGIIVFALGAILTLVIVKRKHSKE